MARYWIIVASKDHVEKGVEGGFAQACHGKSKPLKRLSKGDYVLYYSSKQTFGEQQKCQQFTAMGQLSDDEVYPVKINESFEPFRRNVNFFEVTPVAILPLINELDFIPNKNRWGYPFRWGILEISRKDFNCIAKRMTNT